MEKMLYTVKDVSVVLQVNTDCVYELIKKGYLRAMKLRQYKIRKSTLEEFLAKYDGYDLSDLDNVKELDYSAT